jgi:hypothetical protein
MSKSGWIAIIVIGVVALLVIAAAVFWVGDHRWGGLRWMGPGMMDRWGFGFGPIRLVGMLFFGLIPLGILALIVMGIILMARALGTGRGPTSPAPTCPNCGYAVQAGWQHCPNCGKELP